MQRLFKKSSSSIKNHQPIIITKDGFGCNSHGFAWPWNRTILTSSENVSPLQLHTCLCLRKDSLQSKHWKLRWKLKRKNKQFLKRAINFHPKTQLERQPYANQLKSWMTQWGLTRQSMKQVTWRKTSSIKVSWQVKEIRKQKESKSLVSSQTPSYLSTICQKRWKFWMSPWMQIRDLQNQGWILTILKAHYLSLKMTDRTLLTNLSLVWICLTRREKWTKKSMKAWTWLQARADKDYFQESSRV